MRTSLFSLILIFLIMPINVFSQTPEEYRVKDSNLNFAAAESNLKMVENALRDFRNLTEMIITDDVMEKLKSDGSAEVKIKATDLEKISNINWSIQNIGFHNWILVVKGTLLKSDYLNKKREYELAKCKADSPKRDLAELKEAVDTAFKQYQEFLSKSVYED